ncbi:MAG: SdrD B-like domain-containing protein, partial [Gemmataceae bacterium]
NGNLNSIEIDYDVTEGEGVLRLPGTGLSISSIHGRVENLNQLSDLVLSASVSVAYGPAVTLPTSSKTYDIARANFSASFSATQIYLSGGIYFLAQQTQAAPGIGSTVDNSYDVDSAEAAPNNDPTENEKKLPIFKGVLGSGTASALIDIAQSSAVITANASFADGFIKGSFTFSIDDGLNIYSIGTIGAYFPDVIPIVGGDEILGAGFEFKWNGTTQSGFIAAAVDVLNTDVGFKYDIAGYDGDSNDFEIIFQGPFDGLFSGTTVYTVNVDLANLKNGATQGTFAIDFFDPSLFQEIELTAPNGDVYYSNSRTGGLTPRDGGSNPTQFYSQSPSGQYVFSYLGDLANAYKPVEAGTYVVKLTTSHALSSPPQISASASLAAPQVNFEPSFGQNGVPQAVAGRLTVPLQARAALAVQSNTIVRLYADRDSSGGDGVLVGQVTMPTGDSANPGALTNLSVNADFTRLLPLRYHLYAIIDDGTNAASPPIYLTAQVQANQEIFGTITNQAGQGVPGIFVWIDQNNDGLFTPAAGGNGGDPFTVSTGSNGAYSLPRVGQNLNLNPGTIYNMYVETPDGFRFSSSIPGGGVVEEAAGNRPARIRLPFQFLGGNSTFNANFSLNQAPTIIGSVLTPSLDTSTGLTTNVPLQGVRVYADLNNNSLFDSATEPAGISDFQGEFRLLPMASGATVTLRLDLTDSIHVNNGVPSMSVTASSNPSFPIIVTPASFNVIRKSVISGNIEGYTNSGGTLSSTPINLSGVSVRLLDSNNTTVQTVITDSQGNYAFAPVLPNVAYTVEVAPPGGFREINPQGTSTTFDFQAFSQTFDSAVVADFDGDGLSDIAAVKGAEDYVRIYKGISNGIWSTTPNIKLYPEDTEDDFRRLVLLNFTGDSTPNDLAVVDASNYIYILQHDYSNSNLFFNYGRINFKQVDSGTTPIDLQAADFDGDGHDDIAMSSNSSQGTFNDPHVVIQTYKKIQDRFGNDDDRTHDFDTDSTWFSVKLDDDSGGLMAVGYYDGINDQYADLFVNSGSSSQSPFYVQGGTSPKKIGLSLSAYAPGSFALGFLDNDSFLDQIL